MLESERGKATRHAECPRVRIVVAPIEARTRGRDDEAKSSARYGQAFKDRAVARLLPPESAPLEMVSREIGVGLDTLERWRSESLSRPTRERAWTAVARLEAVIATAAMDKAAKSAWCREHGVYPQQLQQWRDSACQALPVGYRATDRYRRYC